MPTRLWLFPSLPEPATRLLSSLFWILLALVFVIATLDFLDVLVPPNVWRTFAIGLAIVSVIGLGLFGNNWTSHKVGGALLMNLAVLISLPWLYWSPADIF